jgi:hypothetical protein
MGRLLVHMCSRLPPRSAMMGGPFIGPTTQHSQQRPVLLPLVIIYRASAARRALPKTTAHSGPALSPLPSSCCIRRIKTCRPVGGGAAATQKRCSSCGLGTESANHVRTRVMEGDRRGGLARARGQARARARPITSPDRVLHGRRARLGVV